ncbi:hypothetical protein ACFL1C_08650 [Pseudomonadota bacterium]
MRGSGRVMQAMLLGIVLIFVLIGCQGRQDETGPEPESAVKSNLSAAAIRDLAGRLNVGETGITLVREVNVTWRDGSLGCPQKDRMYTQALVEGVLIILRVDGQDYEYHSGSGRPPFLCESPEKPVSKSPAE